MTIRTFIAFAVDPEPQLCRVVDQLGLIGAPVRISKSADLHLTLKFLGATDDAVLPELTGLLNQLAGSSASIRTPLSGLGVFPDRRRPTVVWAGLEEPQVNRLQTHIEERVAELGWDPEQRPFRPHVTLARVNPRKPVPRLLNELLDKHESTEFGVYELNRVVLYQSVTTGDGVRYLPLHEVRLP